MRNNKVIYIEDYKKRRKLKKKLKALNKKVKKMIKKKKINN